MQQNKSGGNSFPLPPLLYAYRVLVVRLHVEIQGELKVAPHLQSLYNYLVENESILSLDFFNRQYLHIFSRDILDRIAANDHSWQDMVPPQVATLIKERGFFRFKAEPEMAEISA